LHVVLELPKKFKKLFPKKDKWLVQRKRRNERIHYGAKQLTNLKTIFNFFYYF
jgi:hypothetical protein